MTVILNSMRLWIILAMVTLGMVERRVITYVTWWPVISFALSTIPASAWRRRRSAAR